MRNYLIIAVLALFAGYGCQNAKTGPQTTKLGNEFILHTASTEGEEAVVGSFAYIHANIRNGDSIVFNTRDNGVPATAVQILSDSLGADRVGPVEDALRGRRVGDSLTVIFRIDTLDQKPPGFENADAIYYDIVVEEIVSESEFNNRREAEQAEIQAQTDAVIAREPEMLAMVAATQKAYQAGTLEDIQTTDSGLKYVIHEPGTGEQAVAGKGVTVQYVGYLAENGNVFDQSFRRGQGISFPLGQRRVIAGWDEGIALLKEGGSATLIIPSELGYGATGTGDGSIPPNAEIMFYVELEEVN
ncbi:hypothetical protein CEQ90_01265 [Lewinellaceae bacterium SD302]|nr:hypothetical protein CEQ90_01265 [Lewinellaceae bacterium SD302]